MHFPWVVSFIKNVRKDICSNRYNKLSCKGKGAGFSGILGGFRVFFGRPASYLAGAPFRAALRYGPPSSGFPFKSLAPGKFQNPKNKSQNGWILGFGIWNLPTGAFMPIFEVLAFIRK